MVRCCIGGTGFQSVRRTGKMPVPPRTFQSSNSAQAGPACRLIAAYMVWSQGRISGRALNWPGPPRQKNEHMVHLGNPGRAIRAARLRDWPVGELVVRRSPVCSYHEWDPLKEVVFGRLEDVIILSRHLMVSFNFPQRLMKIVDKGAMRDMLLKFRPDSPYPSFPNPLPPS